MARGRTRKNTANAATATAPARRGRGNNKPQVAFACKLALNQWLLSLFHVKRFEELAEHLQREDLEGLDENNVHRFHIELSKQFPDLPALPVSQLLEYDQNIVRHTLRLNERRITRGDEPIVWKYFQYLALLFTEIYLDRYFRDTPGLLKSINAQIEAYNVDKPEADQIAPLDESSDAWSQLNKLAFWMVINGVSTEFGDAFRKLGPIPTVKRPDPGHEPVPAGRPGHVCP